MHHSVRRSGGVRSVALAAILALAGAGTGCLYGFAGGGLPPHIRTVAILPFENLTPEPTLTNEVTEAVREAVERRLGLRAAGVDNADAIVRGAVTRYEPDILLQVQPGVRGAPANVTARRVQLTVRVEILDQVEGRTLWQRPSLTVDGEYEPPREEEGRRRALEKLVTDIVNGAQSQW